MGKVRDLMIDIIDFSKYPQNFERTYGGASGRKYDIDYKGEKWFLKFPSNIRDQVKDMSYSNSSVSEFLGSQIYASLGIETHETKLGIYADKCVVACKDLVQEDEFPITGFGEFKTTFVPAFYDSQGHETNGNGTDLEEVIKTLEEHPILKKFPEIEDRFWDMFVVDAFIGNNDRNNGNWGMIKNFKGHYRVSPVFDNGASFFPKSSEEKINKLLSDEILFKNAMYSGATCVFTLGGHRINPLKYIAEAGNEKCNDALKRIFPMIDLRKIKEIIETIPTEYQGISIMSENTKKLYFKLIRERYDKVFVPVLERLEEKNNAISPIDECMKNTILNRVSRIKEQEMERR